MRCLLLIALFVAVASADLYDKNRFYRLLNIYQKPRWYDLEDKDVFWGDKDIYGYGDYSYIDDYDTDYIHNYRRDDLWKLRRGVSTWEDKYDLEDGLLRDGVWDKYDFDTIRDKLDFDTIREKFDFDTIRGKYNLDKIREVLGDDITRGDLWDKEKWLGGEYGQLKDVEDANVKLASRLYKQTKDDKDDKNTVVSPISIQLALAALKRGARGNTKRQISRVIGGRLHGQQQQRRIFNTLARHYKLRGGDIGTLGLTKINPVTLIAVNTRTPAQQWFIQLVTGQLGVHVKHLDFHRRPHESRKLINNWVSRKTNLKLNHIVPRDAITDNTKLVLVNALELKAKWGNQFRRHVTKEAKFYPLETNKVKIVEVLETVGRFNFYEDELVKIVGIPTTQKELTLYVIVPKYKDGLTEVEKLHLQDGVQLKKLLDKTDLRVRHVGVQLPKFQIKHKIDVRRTLRKQGVTDAFDPLRADFSGITGVRKDIIDEVEDKYENVDRYGLGLGLDVLDRQFHGYGDKKIHLNKFIHQATIKITENGITSATGTDSLYDDVKYFDRLDGFRGLELDEVNPFDRVSGLFGGEFLGDKTVRANRAFAFAVKHNPTNQLVLVGRVIDAAQKRIIDDYQTINNVDQF